MEVLIALDGLLLVDRSVYFGSCAGILLQCFIREFVPDNDCNPEPPLAEVDRNGGGLTSGRLIASPPDPYVLTSDRREKAL